MNTYCVYKDGDYQEMTAKEFFSYGEQGLWSARLSSGLIGRPDCSAGNRGPKSKHEVILAIGDGGLEKLVNLGFITCPVCKPEATEGFWDKIKHAVNDKYRITALEDFTNKAILPYDARRLDWEEILATTGGAPNRIYLPENLAEGELIEFKERFQAKGIALPPVGYYDPKAETHFTEYIIP